MLTIASQTTPNNTANILNTLQVSSGTFRVIFSGTLKNIKF